MKKLFLIPLMTLVCSVMAWGADAHVSTLAELQAAIGDASIETIYLDDDIEYYENSASCVYVKRSVTIDGQKHELVGWGSRDGSQLTTFAAKGASGAIDVVVKNLTIINPHQRAVETRGNIGTLRFENCHIESLGLYGGNTQTITFGGNQSSVAEFIVDNSTIKSTPSGYPVISFNPYHLVATNSSFIGYCGLYFKGISSSAGSRGSVIEATNCEFDAPNVHSGLSNAFGVFVLEDDGISITLENCGMNSQMMGDQSQHVFTLSEGAARRQENVSFTIKGDNSHINGNQFILNNWLYSGAAAILAKTPDVHPAATITAKIYGGTYSKNPETTYFCTGTWSYDDGEGIYDVETAPFIIPEGYEVKEITMEGVAAPLYRVVKKAAAYVDPVTSEVTLYDLNDKVPVEGEDYGNNPVSSFDLSSGEDMTLNNEVTKAGYVQISDNVTTDPESGDPVVEPTTVIINKTASDEEQTLVINNGLDVQGDSKVEVKPGASLIIGEGGINTEKPENIVLEVTEDAGAAILLDPTITVNQNPNLTVKLTTNSKQLTASPWTYVYQRFAIPVKVGVVPENDFDGELFPSNTSFKNYVFEWNGYDWVTCSNWSALEPFKGYQLANNSKDGGVTYTFTGQLVGNDNSEYNFPTGGFDFFGNSHLAPIYIDSLLKPYEDQAVEASVWLYNYDRKNFESITSEDIAEGFAFATEIKPMEGFILNYHGATGSAVMNYASAIWGNPKFDAAIGRPSQSNPAPARNRVSETSNRAIINVVAENGQGDNVKLVEKEKYSAEFENGADASKFVYDNAVSIYASTENGELSRVATNDLTGTLLSFNSNDATNYTITLSNVLGEDYALRDNVTGQTIAFAEGATYTFTQAANTTVPARFEVVSAAKLPTAIDNVEEAAKVSGIYTITGQYLGRDFTNLPAGVYIVNGVKIVK